jgi:hypothetical protein
MWYKQVLAQVGGGVSFSGEKPADSIDSNNHQKIDEIISQIIPKNYQIMKQNELINSKMKFLCYK